MHPFNKLVSYEPSKPAISYAHVLENHTVYLWRLTAQYPGCSIDSYDDNVSGAFLQVNHHTDVARANVSIHGNKMIVAVGLHFDGNFGPASWKPIARARCFLAGWMYKHTHHQEELNKEVIDLFNLPDEEDLSEPYTVRPHFDNFNKPVIDKEGAFAPEFWMFVNDLLSAIPHQEKNARHLIASSIESVYVLIGYPVLIKNPNLPPTLSRFCIGVDVIEHRMVFLMSHGSI